MGIWTFIHLVTDDEIEVLKLCEASVIYKVGRALTKRQQLINEDEEGYEFDSNKSIEVVDILHILEEDLKPIPPTKNINFDEIGNEIYLEQKQKFWKATYSSFWNKVTTTYGRKGTKGQSNEYMGTDAKDYFKKKITQKIKGGYKVVDRNALKKKKALAKLKEILKKREEEGREEKGGGKEENESNKKKEEKRKRKRGIIEESKSKKSKRENIKEEKEKEEDDDDDDAYDDDITIVNSFRVVDLRKELKKRHLSPSGNKKELQDRLMEAIIKAEKKKKEEKDRNDEREKEEGEGKKEEKEREEGEGEKEEKEEGEKEIEKGKMWVDLDKAGSLVSYLVQRLTGRKKGTDYECFIAIFDLIDLESDNYPYFAVGTEEVASLYAELSKVASIELVKELFEDTSSFPSVLGGLCGITKERDMEYGVIHFKRFMSILKHAVEYSCGLMIYLT